jgi:transcriptional antiterminator NusG
METFAPGDLVRIKSGPFTNLRGIVKAVNQARLYLNVLIELWGRPTPVELKFSEVEKISV